MRKLSVTFVLLAMLAAGGAAPAGDLPRGVDGVPLGPDGVRLSGHWLEEPVRRAVHRAAQRLAEPSCHALLDRFRDAAGRPLGERLRQTGFEADGYAKMVLFYDGSDEQPCRRPRVHAFTTPGSRIVRVCPALGTLAAREPERADALVIHELLHTLGLGENPPTSDEITRMVEKACRR